MFWYNAISRCWISESCACKSCSTLSTQSSIGTSILSLESTYFISNFSPCLGMFISLDPLILLASPFLHRFLQYFDISLNHLTPKAILHLSMFVHFCEAFLGILPSISLLRYFFHLKPHPRSDNTSVLGGCGIQFHQNKQKEFFEYNLVDSVKD
jgi:hypothetical protein